MISALDIANYFLIRSDDTESDITNLKLNKLLYYAQGYHLALTGKPLFPDEIQAWTHGPVVPNVWRKFRDSGSEPIKPIWAGENEIIGQTKEIVDEVYDVFAQYSASTLRNWTHNEPPWQNVNQNEIITHESMTTYFRTRLKN